MATEKIDGRRRNAPAWPFMSGDQRQHDRHAHAFIMAALGPRTPPPRSPGIQRATALASDLKR